MTIFGVKLNKRGERLVTALKDARDFTIVAVVVILAFGLPNVLADAILHK